MVGGRRRELEELGDGGGGRLRGRGVDERKERGEGEREGREERFKRLSFWVLFFLSFRF